MSLDALEERLTFDAPVKVVASLREDEAVDAVIPFKRLQAQQLVQT